MNKYYQIRNTRLLKAYAYDKKKKELLNKKESKNEPQKSK